MEQEQKCFFGFARVVYVLILSYAKLEMSKLCFERESLVWSWKSRSETVGESREGSTFVLGEKEIIQRSFLQPASEIRPCTASTDHGNDGFLKYVVQKEIT